MQQSHAYPRIMMFVAINEHGQVIGYIQWLQKSGFRKEAVMELEQIAVLAAFQGRKIGKKLILRSLDLVKEFLAKESCIIKAIMVTTRTDNDAKHLYENTIGAKVSAIIKDLYSHDEAIMISKCKVDPISETVMSSI